MKNKNFILLLTLFPIILFSCKKGSKEQQIDEQVEAELREDRSITVILETNEKLFSCIDLKTKEGVLIVTEKEINKDNKEGKSLSSQYTIKDFDKATQNAYLKKDEMTIVLEDRFGIKYKKDFSVQPKGNTKVTITEDDVDENSLSLRKKINRKLNQSKEN